MQKLIQAARIVQVYEAHSCGHLKEIEAGEDVAKLFIDHAGGYRNNGSNRSGYDGSQPNNAHHLIISNTVVILDFVAALAF